MKPKVLITGGTGLLGTHLILNKHDTHSVVATVHEHEKVLKDEQIIYERLNIKDKDQVQELISTLSPEAVIHTAAHGRVDFCEDNKQEAYDTNFLGTKYIVDALKKTGGKIVFCSTNMTFDGLNPPYSEQSEQNPGTYYGQLKVDAEEYIRESGVDYTIVRLMTMYGWNWQPERKNMISMAISKLRSGEELWMTNDVFNNMLFVDEAAKFFWNVVHQKDVTKNETFNISGKDCINRYQTTIEVCNVFELDQKLVTEVSSSYFSGQETPRSPNTCFKSTKAEKMMGFSQQTLQDGLRAMKEQEKIFRQLQHETI